MRRDLAAIHSRVEAHGRPIAGSRVAERIEAQAPRYSSSTATEGALGITDALRERGADYRYGSRGPRPTTVTEPFEIIDDVDGMPGLGEVDEAPITSYPPETSIPYRQLRADMGRQGIQNRAAYSGSRTQPMTPQQEAGTDIYRGSQEVRDEEIAASLGDEGYQDYLERNAASRASGIIAGDDISIPSARSPAGLSETIAAAGGSGPFDVMARLKQRLANQYRDSILATLGEVGSHSPEYLAGPDVPRSVRVLESAAPPPVGPIRNTGPGTEASVRSAIAPASAAMGEATEDRLRLPAIERAGAASPDALAATEAAIAAHMRERNQSFRERAHPSAPSPGTDQPADDAVESHVRERNRAFRERARQSRERHTP
jgi:hypothetical protein